MNSEDYEDYKDGSYSKWDDVWASVRNGNTPYVEQDYITFKDPETMKQLENLNIFEIIKQECKELPSASASLEIGCGRGTISLYLSL